MAPNSSPGHPKHLSFFSISPPGRPTWKETHGHGCRHSILIIAYHMIQRRESYHELGDDYFDKRRPEVTARRLIKRLEQLGFQVDCRLPTQTVG
jgi:hypothetical protein